ncbi:hypothetical protein QEN19_001513 [Hanseniaspora menglaensis]
MKKHDEVEDQMCTQDDQNMYDIVSKDSKEHTPISNQQKESRDFICEKYLTFKEPNLMNNEEKVCISLKCSLTKDVLFNLEFEGGPKALLETDRKKMLFQKDNTPTKIWVFGRNKKKVNFLLPQISRLSNAHFEISLERNCQFYLTDLSRNGTWLNGIKIPENVKMKLLDSDVIGVGYGIEQDCTNYELNFNNTFMAQHKYLFLKNIKQASKTNPNIRSKKDSIFLLKPCSQKRKIEDIIENEKQSVQKKKKLYNVSEADASDVPFISNKLQHQNNENKGLQRSGIPNISNNKNYLLKLDNIHDHYKITDNKLGQGAFAIVKKAMRLIDQKPVAIKIISKAKLVGTSLEGVQSEIEVLRSINHSRIVKLHDFFEDLESFYIVMDLVNGGDLMDFVAENGAIDEDACCEIAFQIVDAVNYMHVHNITHRDLKPDNILIEQDSPVLIKITDFGLAKKGSIFKTFCGTLAYIAPELIQDIGNRNELRPRYMRPEYTTQVDMWSLGCLVYVIMTGHLPFSGSSEEDLFKQIKTGKFHEGPLKMRNISNNGRAFLESLICVDPNKRLKSSEAMKHQWFIENRGSLMEPSQKNIISQNVALSQRPNNHNKLGNNKIKTGVENWKKEPIMDGSSQPWKKQKDAVTSLIIPKGFIPLTDQEILGKKEQDKLGKLMFYHRPKTGNISSDNSNVSSSSFENCKRKISNSYNVLEPRSFDPDVVLKELDPGRPSNYYEEERDAFIKLYPLARAQNTSATKKISGINKDYFTIGRNRLADYAIMDNTISKFHCMFARIPESDDPFQFSWWLYCFSTNPMFVNDIKVTKFMKIKIFVGDAIKFVWNTTRNTYSGFYIPYMKKSIHKFKLKNDGMLENWIEWRNAKHSNPEFVVPAEKVVPSVPICCKKSNCSKYPHEGQMKGYKHINIDYGNPICDFPNRESAVPMADNERKLYSSFLQHLTE